MSSIKLLDELRHFFTAVNNDLNPWALSLGRGSYLTATSSDIFWYILLPWIRKIIFFYISFF